jgi:NADPH:quinone reductase-like Zn-dependent oxidoreductase
VLGCDFAGTAVQVGSEVSRLKVGDKVAALIWGRLWTSVLRREILNADQSS